MALQVPGGVQLEGGALFFNFSPTMALKWRLFGRLWYLLQLLGLQKHLTLATQLPGPHVQFMWALHARFLVWIFCI